MTTELDIKDMAYGICNHLESMARELTKDASTEDAATYRWEIQEVLRDAHQRIKDIAYRIH